MATVASTIIQAIQRAAQSSPSYFAAGGATRSLETTDDSGGREDQDSSCDNCFIRRTIMDAAATRPGIGRDAYTCDAAPPTVEANTSHRWPPSAIPLPSGSNCTHRLDVTSVTRASGAGGAHLSSLVAVPSCSASGARIGARWAGRGPGQVSAKVGGTSTRSAWGSSTIRTGVVPRTSPSRSSARAGSVSTHTSRVIT